MATNAILVAYIRDDIPCEWVTMDDNSAAEEYFIQLSKKHFKDVL